MAEVLRTISSDELRLFEDHIKRLRKVPRDLFFIQCRLLSIAERSARQTDMWLLSHSPDLLMRAIRARRDNGSLRRVLHRRWMQAVAAFGLRVNAPPNQTDRLNAWLRPALSYRLAQLNVRTVEDLALFMRQRGRRWYKGQNGIGVVTADELWNWIASAGLVPSTHSDVPSPEASFGIRPLEYLQLPVELDGSLGDNRFPSQSRKQAYSNDLEAIRAWLAGCRGHTLVAYTHQAEKLMLWATLEQRKPVSSLTGIDMERFFAFLSTPAPWTTWVADRRYSRSSMHWRPFVVSGNEGKSPGVAMSQASVDLSRTILCVMFEWLVRRRYLISNPIHELPLPRPRPSPKVQDHFTADEWDEVKTLLYRLTTDEFTDARLRVALLLAGDAGLAESELVGVRLGHFFEVSSSECHRHLGLHVLGRRKSARMLFLSAEVARAVRKFCMLRHFAPSAERWPRDTPLLVSSWKSLIPLTRKTLYLTTKEFFLRAAHEPDVCALERVELSRELSLASLRWLRHTAAERMVKNGESIADVAASLGHRSLAYTASYFDS